jgi:hypothetical protein
MPYRQRLEPPASFYDGLVAANANLPREAIKAAIVAMSAEAASSGELWAKSTKASARNAVISRHIEQLRALLPEGE